MLYSPVLERPTSMRQDGTQLVQERRNGDFVGSLSANETHSANDNETSLNDELNARLAACQRELSLLSRYLEPQLRSRVIRQLRNLLDFDDWEEGDCLIDVASFRSFVRAMVLLEPVERPMLALSNDGFVIAIWGEDTSRLVMDFFPNDEVRWYVSRKLGERTESAVGNTLVDKLEPVMDALDGRTLLNGAR